MSEKHLDPITIDKQSWMYPEARGLGVVRQVIVDGICERTEMFTIPWRLVNKALKEKPAAPARRKRK